MKSYKRDGNNRVVYSKDMKLIELIDADYELLTLFLRMDIQLPFGDVSVEEMCQRYDMSPTLFLMICQIYACPDFEPDVEALSKDDLRHIMTQYLSYGFFGFDQLGQIGGASAAEDQNVDVILHLQDLVGMADAHTLG